MTKHKIVSIRDLNEIGALLKDFCLDHSYKQLISNSIEIQAKINFAIKKIEEEKEFIRAFLEKNDKKWELLLEGSSEFQKKDLSEIVCSLILSDGNNLIRDFANLAFSEVARTSSILEKEYLNQCKLISDGKPNEVFTIFVGFKDGNRKNVSIMTGGLDVELEKIMSSIKELIQTGEISTVYFVHNHPSTLDDISIFPMSNNYYLLEHLIKRGGHSFDDFLIISSIYEYISERQNMAPQCSSFVINESGVTYKYNVLPFNLLSKQSSPASVNDPILKDFLTEANQLLYQNINTI